MERHNENACKPKSKIQDPIKRMVQFLLTLIDIKMDIQWVVGIAEGFYQVLKPPHLLTDSTCDSREDNSQ